MARKNGKARDKSERLRDGGRSLSTDTDDPTHYHVTLEGETVRRIAGYLWEQRERTGRPTADELRRLLYPLVGATPPDCELVL